MVILIKALLVYSSFVNSAFIINAFKENHSVFGYKLKRFFDSVSGYIVYNKKVIFW